MKMNVCDGCGCVVDEPETFGVVVKKDYCPDCAAVVRGYVERRDWLHDRLSNAWATRLETLKCHYRLKVKELPDE